MSYPTDDQNGVTSEKEFWKPHKRTEDGTERGKKRRAAQGEGERSHMAL